MSNTVIKVENLSKQYKLGTVGTGTLSHDLNRLWAKLRGKEDPYLKVGEHNDRTQKGNTDYVWALKDINFEVQKGDILGVIGRNGAGKSTLLKILSQITRPTTGSVKMKGRVGSLLEVGTGFHHELTGRENIYINGAILGMRKWEIDKKLDEIIDFAGVERYIDTPVKRYSSGMMVRLGFAVAAHLEPEILIVDEVLAVGDAEFQKKCIGKMGEVSKNDGRTILFVSHNMGVISSLCSSSILIDQGNILFNGDTESALHKYFELKGSNRNNSLDDHRWKETLTRKIEFKDVSFYKNKNIYNSSDEIRFKVRLRANQDFEKLRLSFTISSTVNGTVGSSFIDDNTGIYANSEKNIEIVIQDLQLSQGKYYFALAIGIGEDNGFKIIFDGLSEILDFEIKPDLNHDNMIVNWIPGWGNIQFRNVHIRYD